MATAYAFPAHLLISGFTCIKINILVKNILLYLKIPIVVIVLPLQHLSGVGSCLFYLFICICIVLCILLFASITLLVTFEEL